MKRKQGFLLFALICLVLSGCGKNETELYTEEMNLFYETVNNISASINAINPDSDTAPEELLQCLNSMEQTFASLESISVPKEYAQNEDYGIKASSSMKQAVTLYHQAFQSTPFDTDTAADAKSCYEEAMKYASAIGNVMMGYEVELNE